MPTETPIAISISVNGEPHGVPAECSLAETLRSVGLDPEQTGIAVALGDAVVPRAQWSDTTVEAGATIEVITASQGG